MNHFSPNPKASRHMASIRSTVTRVLIYALCLIVFFSLFAIFILIWFPGYPARLLYSILRWPVSILSGTVAGSVVVFLRRTVVEFTDRQITLTAPGSRKTFDIDQFLDSSVIRKEHIFSYGKFITVKCYLFFKSADGFRKYCLYGFSEKDLEHLLTAIRNCQSDSLTEEEKTAIAEQYSEEAWNALMKGTENPYEFQLPSILLISREKSSLKKIGAILLCAMLAVALLDAHALLSEGMLTMQLLFLTVLILPVPFFLLVISVGLRRKRSICAEKIIIGKSYLQIHDRTYSYSYIRQLYLTSPRKKSSSIFPVQRYMYLTTLEGKRKYWLGSEASFGEYHRLCASLEQALISSPDKLKWC